MKESAIQKQIIDYLRLKKYLVVKHNNTGIMKPNGSYITVGQKGVADLICCKDGRFIAIEVKSDSGILSEAQVAFLDEVEERGGVAFVAYSLDDVINKFK
jgi:penicillin-binding protein-related factor A (putative recombinase)